MNWFIFIAVAVLFVVGTLIALAWWRLAQAAAPYADERGKRTPRSSPTDDAIVITAPDASPGHTGGPKS